MLIRLFRYPILFICLWSLVPGIAELSHGGAHQEFSQKETRVSAHAALQKEKAGPQKELPCQSDCDDENCTDHQCHFGHCRILSVVALDFSVPQRSETFFAQDFDTPVKDIAFSLFKPPAASSHS